MRQPCAEDRRAVGIDLTEQGRALIDGLQPEHTTDEQRLLAALDRTSREQVTGLLRTLAESLGDIPPEWVSAARIESGRRTGAAPH
ncbi:hypothetical protein ACW9HR_06595 [Nocardia gipuzkoensis]